MDAASFVIDSQLKQTSYPLTSLDVCDLRLVDDQRWPWLLIIPRVPHAVELIDISPDLRAQVWLEIDHVGRVMRDQFSPHKLILLLLEIRCDSYTCIALPVSRKMKLGPIRFGGWEIPCLMILSFSTAA